MDQEESPFGVNKAHSEIILEFLEFARQRRAQCVKSVKMEFENLIDSRLMEDTFTSEEVKEMITGLSVVVTGDMESELIHTSHTHSLLVAQLLQQAERWHLTLAADMSTLENKEMLETLAQYEQHEFASASLPAAASHRATLAPLEQSGGEKLLQVEISRLEKENAKLQQRLQSVEAKAASALSERDELKKQLHSKPAATTPTPQYDDVAVLQERIVQLQQKLSEGTTHSTVGRDKERELEEKSKELLQTRAELERMRAELEKRFSDTAQYANLRKMLASKNDQIRELRAQLKKFET